jgi:hypothetical protein
MIGLRDRQGIGSSWIGMLAAAFVGAALASPSLASAQDTPPPAEPGPAPAPDGGARPGQTPGGSDEDLEAAVLGGQGAPARPAASAPPRSSTPTPSFRPPGPPNRWPARRADPAADGEGDARPSLAIELGTSGFGSGTLQGGLFLGARLASGLIVGGSLDYASSSSSVSATGIGSLEQSTSTLRVGVGARYAVLHSEDARAELFLAAGLGVVRVSNEVPTSPGSAQNYTATGPSVAAGPGLRFWIHERIALGYVAQFRVTHLSGQVGAFPELQLVTGSVDDASSTNISLEGTFQILGIF